MTKKKTLKQSLIEVISWVFCIICSKKCPYSKHIMNSLQSNKKNADNRAPNRKTLHLTRNEGKQSSPNELVFEPDVAKLFQVWQLDGVRRWGNGFSPCPRVLSGAATTREAGLAVRDLWLAIPIPDKFPKKSMHMHILSPMVSTASLSDPKKEASWDKLRKVPPW